MERPSSSRRCSPSSATASGYLVAQPNCSLDDAPVIWSGARLANRVSRKRSRMCLLVRRPSTVDLAEATDVVVAYLPVDLRMGDVLALPSRVHAKVGAAPADDRLDVERSD